MNDLIPPQGTMTIDAGKSADSADARQADTAEAAPRVLDEQQAQRVMEVLRGEQNLVMGTLTGLLAAFVGAGVWAAVTVVTEIQIGWMAVGVGVLVAFATRFAGKGITPAFGVVSAALALLGCAAGNLLTVTWFIADSEGMGFTDVAMQISPAVAYNILTSTFEAMDVLFYGLAAYCGYKYAFRQVSPDDVDRALGKAF